MLPRTLIWRPQAIAACLATFANLVLTASLLAIDEAPSLDSQLRQAGIEPTEPGVRAYLDMLVSPELGRQIDGWIAELGEEQYVTRQHASQRLMTLGPVGIEKLQAASKSADAERAWRARSIVNELKSSESSPLSWALQAVRDKRLAVGLPLLLKVREQTASAQLQEAAVAAMLAIVKETDRPLAEKLLEDDDRNVRNAGRRLLARLDRNGEPLLEGTFEAVALQPGSVAGGGPNLVQGWEFEVKSDLVVTHLGIYDEAKNGLTSPHALAIWDVADNSAPVVDQIIPVGEAAELGGVFRLVPVEGTVLKVGRRYAIVAHYPDPRDSAVSLVNPSGLTIEYAPHLEVLGRRYSFPHGDMAFPASRQEGVKHATHGPTFRYEVVAKP